MRNMNIHSDRKNKYKRVIELHKSGKSKTEISDHLGVPRSTVHDWVTGRRRGTTVKTTIIEGSDEDGCPLNIITEEETVDSFGAPYISRSEFQQEQLREFLENIHYVKYPAPTKPKKHMVANDVAMVIGDMHFGYECWDTLNIFFQCVEELKPSKIILNGDTVDLLAVSSYTKDPRTGHSIQDEIVAYHKFLKILHDITEEYQTEILETNGNHSGNGIEGRWWRYLANSSDIKPLLEIPKIAESLSYQRVFYPDGSWCRVKLIEGNGGQKSTVELPGSMFVFHGEIVRKHGGFSARGNFEKYNASTITNHTHRQGSHYITVPQLGSRPIRIIKNYENGCACQLNPEYVDGANWQNGFAIVNYHDNNTAVELVTIENKSAIINSLQKTVKV